MTNIQITREALIKYLICCGYTQGDAVILNAKTSSNFTHLNDLVYYHAQLIGERKGWGREGVIDYHMEICEELEKEIKLNIADEADKEFDQLHNP